MILYGSSRGTLRYVEWTGRWDSYEAERCGSEMLHWWGPFHYVLLIKDQPPSAQEAYMELTVRLGSWIGLIALLGKDW